MDFTVIIPARNAAGTIERAVTSALAQRPSAILLIDHASSDGTAERARRAGGALLHVLTASAEATLGQVRQLGLDAVATAYGMWLDADDEVLHGRAERLLGRLEADAADFAFDEIDLYGGATGERIRRLSIPSFLGERQLVRLFERNYLPGPGVPAFRTSAARALGFDPALHGAEDVDTLLRAVAADHRIALVRHVGYRQFAYAGTLSRDLGNQALMMRVALGKHDPLQVEARFRRAGYHPRTVAWGMVAFLTQRGDYRAALTWVERLPPGSRREFQRGTLLAALGRHDEAVAPLEAAFDEAGAPELCNNFGVVLAALNRQVEANSLFADALRQFPEYHDASVNLLSERPSRLTLLPLRSEPVRADY
jgi:tetratricopeptide (TPR) repeat protein